MNVPNVPHSFYPLDTVVRDICLYLGDVDSKRLYVPVSRMLKHALNEMEIHMSPTVKSVILPVLQDMTVDVPNDIEAITKVGICCGGEIQIIGRNDKLCLPEKEKFFQCCDCDKTANTNTQGEVDMCNSNCSCDACTFHNVVPSAIFNGWDGFWEQPYLYGYAPKMFVDTGTYRYDIPSGKIILSGGCKVQPGSSIVLEYSASITDDKYQLVPRKAFNTLKHRVAQDLKSNADPNGAEWEHRHFKKEWAMLKRTYDTFTLEDFLAALRGGYHSSVKR